MQINQCPADGNTQRLCLDGRYLDRYLLTALLSSGQMSMSAGCIVSEQHHVLAGCATTAGQGGSSLNLGREELQSQYDKSESW